MRLGVPRTSAVTTWAGVQCLAVVAGAAGVRLWPHHPDPPQSLALAEVVGVQIVAAALLFPSLFTDLSTTSLAVALLLPFDQLAGLLSATPESAVLRSVAFVGLWVFGLAGWAQLTLGRASAFWAVTAASLLTLGGAAVWYGRAERLATDGLGLPPTAAFGPLLAGIAQITAPDAACWEAGWGIDALPLVSVVVIVCLRLRSNFLRQSLHNSPP